jgi:hypothetical protein
MNREQIDAITVRVAEQLHVQHRDDGGALVSLGGVWLDSAPSGHIRDLCALEGATLRLMLAIHGALLAAYGLAPGVLPAEAKERCRVIGR